MDIFNIIIGVGVILILLGVYYSFFWSNHIKPVKRIEEDNYKTVNDTTIPTILGKSYKKNEFITNEFNVSNKKEKEDLSSSSFLKIDNEGEKIINEAKDEGELIDTVFNNSKDNSGNERYVFEFKNQNVENKEEDVGENLEDAIDPESELFDLFKEDDEDNKIINEIDNLIDINENELIDTIFNTNQEKHEDVDFDNIDDF